ncbi:MAG: hypothetical protein V4474_03465 [Patescibacteria group bacterium]
MSQKVIWIIVAVVVVVAGLWYFNLIPGIGGDQSAAVANARPSSGPAYTAAQNASVSLKAAGKDDAKVQASQQSVRAAIGALGTLYTQLAAAIQAASIRGNDMGVAQAALKDYQVRMSVLTSAPLNGSNAASLAAAFDVIASDISKINSNFAAATK